MLDYGRDWLFWRERNDTENLQSSATGNSHVGSSFDLVSIFKPNCSSVQADNMGYIPSKNCTQFYRQPDDYNTSKSAHYMMDTSFTGQSYEVVPHECYHYLYHAKDRFLVTLTVICLPLVLYFFEVLRFRIFSNTFDAKWFPYKLGSAEDMPMWVWLARGIPKFIGNFLTILVWPFVTLFRQFWFAWVFFSDGTEGSVYFNKKFVDSQIIASR